jgi:hypothetical protein
VKNANSIYYVKGNNIMYDEIIGINKNGKIILKDVNGEIEIVDEKLKKEIEEKRKLEDEKEGENSNK